MYSCQCCVCVRLAPAGGSWRRHKDVHGGSPWPHCSSSRWRRSCSRKRNSVGRKSTRDRTASGTNEEPLHAQAGTHTRGRVAATHLQAPLARLEPGGKGGVSQQQAAAGAQVSLAEGQRLAKVGLGEKKDVQGGV